MGPIRIDENSTKAIIDSIFELQKGEVFGVAPEFFKKFRTFIPKDRHFIFTHILEGSSDYAKYGSNCYKVFCNQKVRVLK